MNTKEFQSSLTSEQKLAFKAILYDEKIKTNNIVRKRIIDEVCEQLPKDIEAYTFIKNYIESLKELI